MKGNLKEDRNAGVKLQITFRKEQKSIQASNTLKTSASLSGLFDLDQHKSAKDRTALPQIPKGD